MILEAPVKETPRRAAPKTSGAMKELDSLIGLDEVKKVVRQAVDYAMAQKLYQARGFKTPKLSMHMVFCGNPGTAKTTVARIIAKVFREQGVLSKGKLFEVGRAQLVGRYSGWTATQTKEIFKKAEGSVLFIDEAYSLLEETEGHFGDEAINTIVQEMENHREDMVVILAGYKEPMKALLARNSGLSSRITFHMDFKDYTEDELFQIFQKLLKENERCIRPEDEKAVRSILCDGMKHRDFGNGRYVRNMVEHALLAQASRLMRRRPEDITDEDIRCLSVEDLSDPMPADEPEKKEKEPELPPKRLIGFLR